MGPASCMKATSGSFSSTMHPNALSKYDFLGDRAFFQLLSQQNTQFVPTCQPCQAGLVQDTSWAGWRGNRDNGSIAPQGTDAQPNPGLGVSTDPIPPLAPEARFPARCC